MITVRIIYLDGSEDLKDVVSLDEICLDGVSEIRPIRTKE